MFPLGSVFIILMFAVTFLDMSTVNDKSQLPMGTCTNTNHRFS